MNQAIIVQFHGDCQPVMPFGIACYGFVAKLGDRILKTEQGLATRPLTAESTVNVAYYVGLIKALEWLLTHNLEKQSVTLQSDSELVINQVDGYFNTQSYRLIPLHDKAEMLRSRFRDSLLISIQPEDNQEAAALVKQAYGEALDQSEMVRESVKDYLATEKQQAFLSQLGIRPDKYLSKKEASLLIGNRLRQFKK